MMVVGGYPFTSRHGRTGPYVEWESSWGKVAVAGASLFVVGLLAAYLRHWQWTRVAHARRAAILEEEKELRAEWVRRVRVVGDEAVRLAASGSRGTVDALPGVVLALDDGTRVALRPGVPVSGLEEVKSGFERRFELAPESVFWIAAKPTERAAEVAHGGGTYRDGAPVVELEPYDDVYRCGVGEPPPLGPPLPELPAFRPRALVAYAVAGSAIALMPLGVAEVVAFTGAGVALFGEFVATLVPFAPPHRGGR